MIQEETKNNGNTHRETDCGNDSLAPDIHPSPTACFLTPPEYHQQPLVSDGCHLVTEVSLRGFQLHPLIFCHNGKLLVKDLYTAAQSSCAALPNVLHFHNPWFGEADDVLRQGAHPTGRAIQGPMKSVQKQSELLQH